MDYTTKFQGILEFKKELLASQLAYLVSITGEDRRDHPEWDAPDGFYYLDLRVTDDFSALEWSGAEKTYGMDVIVNTVIDLMQKQWPDFELEGKLAAQGEDVEDRWELTIEDGRAVRRDIVITGQLVECPHCGEKFIIESAT